MNNSLFPWKRVLYARLNSDYNKKKVIEIGNTDDDSQKPRIVVVGHKYPSIYKDEFVVDIYNLSYKEVIEIIRYKLYNIEIIAGYENTSAFTIFSGGIVYVTNERKEHNTNIVHLICASKLVARANQARNNFSLKSGLNIYQALQYVNQRAGVKNSNITEEFKDKFISETTTASKNINSFLDAITDSSETIFASGDGSDGEFYSIWDLKTSNTIATLIEPDKGMIIDGMPEATSDGIKFKSLPVINYKVGKLIKIDGTYIDVSVNNLRSAISTPLTTYIDDNGLYIIFQLDYSLDNYGTSNFYVNVTAKARNIFARVVGDQTNE